mmetsp:Transcript_68053/g.127095  ORF Transcript_68053/g.127095 Transcript_68053/m.127095 type:complete len:247 (-) Transcript_68053:99-839(-)
MAVVPTTYRSVPGMPGDQQVSSDAAEAIDLMRQIMAARSQPQQSVQLAVPTSGPDSAVGDEESPEVQRALNSLAEALITLRDSQQVEQVVLEKEVLVPQIQTVEKQVFVPEIQTVERIVPQIQVAERQVVVPEIRTVEKVVPQIQTVEKQVIVPEVRKAERRVLMPEVQTVERIVPVLQSSSYPTQQVRRGMMTRAAPMLQSLVPCGGGQQARSVAVQQPESPPSVKRFFKVVEEESDDEWCGCFS